MPFKISYSNIIDVPDTFGDPNVELPLLLETLGKHAEVISEVVERCYTLIKEANGLVLFKTAEFERIRNLMEAR